LACPDALERAVAEQTGNHGFSGLTADLTEWNNTFDFRALVDGGWLIDTSDEPNASLPIPARAGTIARTAMTAVTSKPKKFEAALKRVADKVVTGEIDEGAPTMSVSLADIAWQSWDLSDLETRIVIDYDTAGKDLPMVKPDELSFKPDATYLITGGFGGFGHKTAEWLIENGARHIVLTGRSGAAKPAAKAIVEHLESLGATIVPAACDTSEHAAVSELIASITSDMPPLKGVFHCGAVIIDQAVTEADLDSFNTVLRSKATGAYNLHDLTSNMELDHFVLFSSIANFIGNSRQSAYSAANGYLNSLAHLRRAQGLPALAVNWGAIDDVGVVAEDEKLELFFK